MASFAVDATSTTFLAVIRGSAQDAVEPERFTVTMHFANLAEWHNAVALTTSRWHIHQPLGGSIVVDVARGAGQGALSIEGLGNTSALLVDLRATTYLPGGAQRQATATFVRTAPWT